MNNQEVILPFSNDTKEEIIVPSNNNTESEYIELITEGLEEAIGSHVVKRAMIQSTEELFTPAYLLDMTKVHNATEESLKAILGLVGGGDTGVYMKNGDETELIGFGEEVILYSVLDGIVRHMYNGLCDLYKNTGNGFKKYKVTDVSTVRLNL